MVELNEGFVNIFLNMGFVDSVQICKVFILVKNDLNVVVVVLIGEGISFDFEDMEVKDIEM